jgi:hypothetical protein
MELTITVNKADLLAKMKENRDKHRQVFIDSLEGYRKALLDELEAHVKDLQNGKAPVIHIGLPRPTDHTREYDRVIGMLEMDKGSEFTLDETTYAQYVDDDWHWKRQWLRMSSSYAAGSTISNYGADALEDD